MVIALSRRSEGRHVMRDPIALTAREADVWRGLSEGLSNSAIAAFMVINEKSVENYVHSIYTKLGIEPDPNTNPRVLAAMQYWESTWLT